MKRVEFTKMHGVGNDFVVFDAPVPAELLTASRLRALADRRTGIGFDQVLLLEPPRQNECAAYYRIFNADGGEVEQCGNGARCIAALLQRRGRAQEPRLILESPAGLIRAQLGEHGEVSVDLGVPDFDPRSLPFTADAEAERYALELDGGERVEIGAVSIGNPHAVLTVPSVESAPVARLGSLIEHHARFPRRVNVGFLEILSPAKVRLRVFERGVGETSSCGTGACAAVAVARRRGLLDARVHLEVRGGNLQVHWAGVGEHIWLTGAAEISFEGHVEV